MEFGSEICDAKHSGYGCLRSDGFSRCLNGAEREGSKGDAGKTGPEGDLWNLHGLKESGGVSMWAPDLRNVFNKDQHLPYLPKEDQHQDQLVLKCSSLYITDFD